MNNNASILLLKKESGKTSFSSLGPIKKLIDPKVGHAGTLDKFATGLMIVLTGQLTKLNTLFSNLDKRYVATLVFGSETDTLDPDGKIIETGTVPKLETIEKILKEKFSGKITQHPPIYSAVHIDGKRAYRLARKGERFNTPSREVEIYSTKIIEWDSPNLVLEVHCSKGTYIRSIARDLALECNSRAHLAALERTAIGPYNLSEAVEADDYTQLRSHASESTERLMRLPNIGKITIDEEATRRLCFGNLPPVESIIEKEVDFDDDHAVLFSPQKEVVGVVALDETKNPIKTLAIPCSRRNNGNI
ncbi:MAG: tRNA pseudouridine(55) synthase TruB [Sphaerochaetaceae bacterium]